MKKNLRLPIGIENFRELRTQGFYYIDKTAFLVDLLSDWSKVNLITRPRRFGKSLNMNMLKTFLEIGQDASLFDGLKVSEYPELCEEFMGQFPVISISLKGVEGNSFEKAKEMLLDAVSEEYERHQYLMDSPLLSNANKDIISSYLHKEKSKIVLENSLKELSKFLYYYYKKPAIILIDEYDVPLNKANQNGYYDEMVSVIRGIFHQALKGNDNLYFAVLTGCLRVSKESIFTGLNNLDVYPITDVRLCEHFGFTNDEVKKMLEYYNLSEHFETMKSWYDGYRFGNMDVYCPWDVIKYCNALLSNPNAKPEAFWANTSGNDIIRTFIDKAKATTKKEIEQLIAGETIHKTINQQLTYNELYANIENMWSMLFMTGYVTQRGAADGDDVQLVIPNLGIRKIFKTQIYAWFQEKAIQEPSKLDAFCTAFQNGDAEGAETQFREYLRKTISIRDTYVKKDKKENFYHGILLGLLSHMEDWIIMSNKESGDGYSDILIEIEDCEIGIVIEVKYGENADLNAGCTEALAQIEKMNYDEKLLDDGMTKILKYGVACYKKQCKIVLA